MEMLHGSWQLTSLLMFSRIQAGTIFLNWIYYKIVESKLQLPPNITPAEKDQDWAEETALFLEF